VAGGFVVIVIEAVAAGLVALVADTVKVAVPEAVGVPDSTPPELSVRPAGRLPLTSANVGAGYPDDGLNVYEYAVPTVAVGGTGATPNAGAEAGGTTVNETARVASAPTPLVAVTVNEYGPAVPVDGVPASTPALLNVSPTGSGSDVVNVDAGKPGAVNVWVYGVPTVAVAGAAPVNVGAAAAGLTTIEIDAVVTEAVALVADTVKVAVPEAVGVPVNAPFGVSASPAGRLPVSIAKTAAG